jgi:threonine/homoserine/homoserine lactone efflux protein
MVDPSLYAAFVAAVVILMLIPGPNVALIVANSVSSGTRYGLMTVAGTACAMVPQLVRWIGAAYLVFLGVQQWRAIPADLSAVAPQPRSLRSIWARGFLVSLSNPKTLLFYGAFLPQFISPVRPAMPQLVVLCVTCVAGAVVIDSLWAMLAGRARHMLTRHARIRNRVSGGFLVGAGIGLALARVK